MTRLRKMYKNVSTPTKCTKCNIPFCPSLWVPDSFLWHQQPLEKHYTPRKFSYLEYHNYRRFNHLSQQWCCSCESQWACPCLWMHPVYYQLQNLHYLTSLAFQALWLNFSMCTLTMQGLRRLTKRSTRPMITDLLSSKMLSKIVVLVAQGQRYEMNPQRLLFSGSNSC